MSELKPEKSYKSISQISLFISLHTYMYILEILESLENHYFYNTQTNHCTVKL